MTDLRFLGDWRVWLAQKILSKPNTLREASSAAVEPVKEPRRCGTLKTVMRAGGEGLECGE